MCKLVLLQLSDLHFGIDNQNTRDMRDRLKVDVIKRAVAQQFHYDGLVISGDIIWGRTTNKKKAYKEAAQYINDIQNKIGIKKSSTYLVAGNHDVDISNVERSNTITSIRSTYSTRNGAISSEDALQLTPNTFFQQSLYKQVTGKPYTPGHKLIRGKYVDFLCLDSSYTCTKSKEDFGQLILGMKNVSSILKQHSDDKRLIVISHHRYDWLKEQEKNNLLNLLSRHNTVLYCCGHIHTAEASTENSIATNSTEITVSVAPTLVDDLSQNIVMGYNILHIDTDNGMVWIESYDWKNNAPHYSLNWKYPEEKWNETKHVNVLSSRIGLRINSCELYFGRIMRKLSLDDLHEATGIQRKTLETYEKINGQFAIETMQIYPECRDSIDIIKLAYALNVRYETLVATPQYAISYKAKIALYGVKKGIRSDQMPVERKKTKIVVFDFDGTLTKNASLRTSWERMWVSCGYTVDDCRKLHSEYSLGQFGHQEWCDRTAEKFKNKSFSRKNIEQIAQNIELLDDCRDVLKLLHSKGIQLFIVSGSVDILIKKVLGDELANLFSKIQANQMQFNQDGFLEKIIGTKYDFERKADYVKGIIDKGYLSSNEIVFFGNSFNDESVCSTGVRAVCINPKQTVSYNPSYWTDERSDVTSMKDFLQFIKLT